MGAVQSCLPFLKSKVPVTSGAEIKAVLNDAEKVVEALKLNVPDELVAIIPQVAIDEAVKKVMETVVEKVAEEVIDAKELASQIKEMEKVD